MESITFLDLVDDVIGVICKLLTFKEQLQLRAVCMGMHNKLTYSLSESNLLGKINRLVNGCNRNILKWYGVDVHQLFLYKPVRYMPIDLEDCYRYEFTKTPQIKMVIIIQHKQYTAKEVINDISKLIVLDMLVKLMDLDTELRGAWKSFDRKDRKRIADNSKRPESLHEFGINKSRVADNLNHLHKTDGCYKKYRCELTELFEGTKDDEWFNKVKQMITGKIELVGFNDIDDIEDKISFGKEILKNYKEVRHVLSKCKERYHDKKFHPNRYQ